MADVSFLFYSHSEYNDLWPILLDNLNKLPLSYKKYIGVDKSDVSGLEGFDTVLCYTASMTYPQKVLSLLEQITTPYVVFIHDNDLIMNFNTELFNQLMDHIHTKSIDRCMFGIVNSTATTSSPLVLQQVNNYSCPSFVLPYDVGPSIWKTESFKQALASVSNATYRNIEQSNIQHFCSKHFKMFAFLSYERAYYVMGRPFPSHFQFLHLCVAGNLYEEPYYMDQKDNFIRLKQKYPDILKRKTVTSNHISFNRFPGI
jgi:hypothetical protein